MGYLDYTPPKAWGGLGEQAQGNLFKIGQMLQEQRRTAAYEGQIAATNKKLEQDELRAKIADARQAALDKKASSEAIASAASAGRYGAAAAEARSMQYDDPRNPGHMRGVSYREVPAGPPPMEPRPVGPEPTQPGMNLFPSQNPADYDKPPVPSEGENDFYKAMSPEQARVLAISRAHGMGPTLPSQNEADYHPVAPESAQGLLEAAAGEQAAGVSERQQQAWDQHETDQQLHDVRAKAYPAEQKAYADRLARPNIELGYDTGRNGPDGKAISDVLTIDPREEDRAKGERALQASALFIEAADRMEKTNPTKAADLREQAAMFAAQVPASMRAGVEQVGLAKQTQDAQMAREVKKNASQEKIGAGNNAATVAAAALRANAGGGYLPDAPAQRVLKEVDDSLAPMTRKGGYIEMLKHSEDSITALQNDPGNPVNWVNAIDAAIKTNTGKAAILAQYKLYTGKAAGANDTAEQLWAGLTGAGLSDTQKHNLMGSFVQSNSNLRQETKRAYDKYQHWKKDKRVTSNPSVAAGIDSREQTVFSDLPGWNGEKGATNKPLPNMPAPKPQGKRIEITNEKGVKERGTIGADGIFHADPK